MLLLFTIFYIKILSLLHCDVTKPLLIYEIYDIYNIVNKKKILKSL